MEKQDRSVPGKITRRGGIGDESETLGWRIKMTRALQGRSLGVGWAEDDGYNGINVGFVLRGETKA